MGLLVSFAFKFNLRRSSKAYKFPVPLRQRKNCDFSYAGLKTAVRMTIERDLGKAVQVEPMKSKLKVPGTRRLKEKKRLTPFKCCFQIELAPLHLGGEEGAAGAGGQYRQVHKVEGAGEGARVGSGAAGAAVGSGAYNWATEGSASKAVAATDAVAAAAAAAAAAATEAVAAVAAAGGRVASGASEGSESVAEEAVGADDSSRERDEEEDAQIRADIAASFQASAVKHLEERVKRAVEWANDSLAASHAASGRPRPNILFILPKFPMLHSPNSTYFARIMPNYSQFCRQIHSRP